MYHDGPYYFLKICIIREVRVTFSAAFWLNFMVLSGECYLQDLMINRTDEKGWGVVLYLLLCCFLLLIHWVRTLTAIWSLSVMQDVDSHPSHLPFRGCSVSPYALSAQIRSPVFYVDRVYQSTGWIQRIECWIGCSFLLISYQCFQKTLFLAKKYICQYVSQIFSPILLLVLLI